MQLALFDLELQQPAASTKLSASRPAFRSILGSCGHDGAEHCPTDGGVDLVYCLHQVSVSTPPRDQSIPLVPLRVLLVCAKPLCVACWSYAA